MSPVENPALIPPGALPAQRLDPSAPASRPAAREQGGASGASFAEHLQAASAPASLTFSRHALARVQRRGIELDTGTLTRLSQGVDRAASKGARESLVLVDGTAFVVSVGSRTVITAVAGQHMKDSVFTNIDSAVIA